jgi:hypothetical protein
MPHSVSTNSAEFQLTEKAWFSLTRIEEIAHAITSTTTIFFRFLPSRLGQSKEDKKA